MSLDDLTQLLDKDAVIYTYRPDVLLRAPGDAEHRYAVYARTHIPLGETDRYVDTIFRWVGGTNKSVFVGAVVGDYGQGKTSFLVHIWKRCAERQVLAVPPFTLDPEGINSHSGIIERIMQVVDGWVRYRLGQTHPHHAARAAAAYDRFRASSLEEVASRIAHERGLSREQVLEVLKVDTVRADTAVTVSDLYDYLETVSQIVEDTGIYQGLLVLLDEPEVAAKTLSTNEVAKLLFDIADTAGTRDGNYGFFMAIAANFYATAESSFASLTARLQRCNCRVVLDNLYGADFARQLWARFCERLDITEQSDDVVLPATLEAIGQLGSSARHDLGYGPRTVVSAFRQMIARFRTLGAPYHPADFAADCLSGEVYVKADYPTRVTTIFSMPEVADTDERLRLTLATFPNGARLAWLEAAGFPREEVVAFQRQAPGQVYRTGEIVGFYNLRPDETGRGRDLLREAIEALADEYAARPETFIRARTALVDLIVPALFAPRQGQQLTGWEYRNPNWQPIAGASDTIFRELAGAFSRTSSTFPLRTVAVAVGGVGIGNERLHTIEPSEKSRLLDAIIHIRLNWSGPPTPEGERLTFEVGDPRAQRPGLIGLTVDINHDPMPEETLEQYVDPGQQRPMFLLYLLEGMGRRSLPHQEEALWKTIRSRLIERLAAAVFGPHEMAAIAGERTGEPVRPGMELVPDLLRTILQRRYPTYETIIRQPQWQSKVKDYQKLLSDRRIPLGVRRGVEVWNASDEEAAKVLGVNKMNLESAFTGYERLITVRSKGRRQGVEVQFHLHPLEQMIRETIERSPNPKQTFEGRQCSWMPLQGELMNTIFTSGYLQEEIYSLLNIGKERGAFSAQQKGKSLVMYCLPLDVPALRQGLREKLAELQRLDAEMVDLGAPSHADQLEKLGREVEGLKDEVEHDRLMRLIENERNVALRNLTAHCQNLEQRITKASAEARELRQRFDASRTTSLTRELAGRAPWVGELERIRIFLLNAIQQARGALEGIEPAVERARAVARDLPDAPVRQRLDRLKDAVSKVKNLEASVQEREKQLTEQRRQVEQFDNWRTLLAHSDEVHTALVKMEHEPAHHEQVAALRKQFDAISQQITGELQRQHVNALGTSAQWRQRVSAIDEAIKAYVRGLRDAFQKLKERANQLLRETGLGDVQLRQPFDQENVELSERGLFEEAAERLREAVEREEEGLRARRLDVLYYRDVLHRIPDDEGREMQERLDAALTHLAEARSVATVEAVKQAVSHSTQWPSLGLSAIGNAWVALRDALDAARNAQRGIRLPHVQTQPPDSEEARRLLALIPENTNRDLKDLVLGMLREGGDTASVLDVSLSALTELFRLGHVEIRVQRSGRR